MPTGRVDRRRWREGVTREGQGRAMPFTSRLPPIYIPSSPLTPYVLERARELAGKTAFIDRRGRTHGHLRRVRAGGATPGRWLAGEGPGERRGRGHHGAQLPRLRRRLPRRCDGRRRDHDDQPDLHIGRDPPPARRRRSHSPRHGPDVPRNRDRGARRHEGRGDLRHRSRRRATRPSTMSPAHRSTSRSPSNPTTSSCCRTRPARPGCRRA